MFEMRNITKFYGGIPALQDVDFVAEEGIIHAVLGENGAGKSTLMKLLSGVIRPDAGEILVDGKPVFFESPRDALRHGIVCMFQELSLVPNLTVGDNLVLGGGETAWGFMKKSSYAYARATLDRVGGKAIPLGALVKDLSLAERQLVEIAKALFRKPRLLILDEATSALSTDAVDVVFEVIRELRDRGTAILFISHRFHEVDRLAERMSVFRNGRHIKTFPAGEYDHAGIVKLMIGQSLKEMFPPRRSPVPADAPVVLSVDNLCWDKGIDNVGLQVKAGQIIGLGGLDGQGQQMFLLALFGLLKGVSGRLTVSGRHVRKISPNRAKRPDLGLALVPEDRKTEGLILDMSIADNLNLAVYGERPFGMLGKGDPSQSRIKELIERMGLVYRDLRDPVSSLSGGNQQKVVLSKWLATRPKCLLLLDPTRGIDVKAKAQIYELLRSLSEEGMAIVFQSTDHEELIHLCDKVYVFYNGRVNRVLDSGNVSAESLIAASMNLSVA